MATTQNLTPTRAKQALWHHGCLSWKWHAGQLVIEEAYNKVQGKLFIANCPRRFGKTYWLVSKCVETALQTPNARVKIATAFLKDLEEFIVPTFQQVLDDIPDSIRPQWLASKKKFIFKNKSEIQLIGLDKNPDGGRGNRCNLYCFEEAGFIKNLDYLYSSVVIPMTMYQVGAKVIMISTPSVTPAHPFEQFCQRAENQSAYVKLTIYDNPLATPELIEEYKKECLSETDWKREYLCEWAVDERLILIPEWRDTYVKQTQLPEFFQYFHRYVSMDLGVRDFTAVLFGYYDFKRATLVIQEELTLNGPELTTLLLKDRIVATEKQLWDKKKPYRRISDNNNLILIQDLSALHDLHFAPTNKDTLEAMVNEVRMFIGSGRLEVSPTCKKLIGCLKYGVWNPKRNQFDRSKEYGHFDHLAALVYLIRNLDQVTNPIPASATYRFDAVNPDDTSTKKHRELERLFGPKFK